MYVEPNCTINLGGRDFTAGGAVVDHDAGRVVGYLASHSLDGFATFADNKARGVDRAGDTGDVKTWRGEKMGTYRVISAWRTYSCHGWPTDHVSIRAIIGGIAYHGRGQGSGMVAFLRRAKS